MTPEEEISARLQHHYQRYHDPHRVFSSERDKGLLHAGNWRAYVDVINYQKDHVLDPERLYQWLLALGALAIANDWVPDKNVDAFIEAISQ